MIKKALNPDRAQSAFGKLLESAKANCNKPTSWKSNMDPLKTCVCVCVGDGLIVDLLLKSCLP